MAEKEKDNVELAEETKESKDKKPAKEPKEKIGLGKRIKKFFKDYISEIKKITWPNREYVVKNTTIVVGAIVIVAAIVGALDLGFTAGLQFLADFRRNL